MLKTRFWQQAARSLPASVRGRYLEDIAQAERFDLALESAIDAWSQLKGAFAARRPTHQH